MAWNDPPSFDYQQISNSGRKFKHRYVLSDTNSKFGSSSPQFHQTPPLASMNQFQHQQMAPTYQGQTQQSVIHDHNPPNQLIAPQATYNNNNDNGTPMGTPSLYSSGHNGAYQGFDGHIGSNVYATNDSSHNNFSTNNETMMYPNQPQQYQSQPPPPPQSMMSEQQQQQQAFQPQ